MSQINPYQSPAQIPLEPAVYLQQEPSFGRVLAKSCEVFVAQWPAVLAALLLLCLPWELIYSYVEYFVVSEEDPWLLIWLMLASPLTFILLAEAVVIAATRQHVRREEGGVVSAFARAIVSFPKLFLWMLASGFVIGLASILCLLPGVYLNIRWMYVSAAVINESGSSETPLNSSWRLTETRQGFSVLVFLGLCVPMLVVIVGPALLPLYFVELDHWLISAGIALLGDLALLFVSIGFACAYHELSGPVKAAS